MTHSSPTTTVPVALQSLATSRPTPSLNIRKYDRQFARRKWREELGDLFMFRGKIVPSFAAYAKGRRGVNSGKPLPA